MASFPAAGCVRGSPTWADESASAMSATPRETDGRLASIAAAAACRGVLRRAVAATSSGCAQRRAREAGDALFLDSCRETMRRRETMRHLHIGSLRHRYGGGGVPPGRAKRARAEVKVSRETMRHRNKVLFVIATAGAEFHLAAPRGRVPK